VILSQRTTEIIKNFAAINPDGIVWPEGSTLSVDPPHTKTMLAVAEIDEINDNRFAILDLVQFYSALSTFDKPELELDGMKIRLSDAGEQGNGTFLFSAASELIIKQPREVIFPEEDTISFEFNSQMVSKLFRGVGIVGASKIAITAENGDMFARGYDPDNSGMNQYKIPLGDSNKTFTFVFLVDHLTKLMKGLDYVASISPRGIARFKGDKLTYYISSEAITT
jgi:hypothetical protein